MTSSTPDPKRGGAVFSALTAAYMIIALVGGGSSTNPLAVGALRLLAIPLLVWSAWRIFKGRAVAGAGALLWLLAAAVAVVAIQCAPIPPALWRLLPGHGTVSEAYAAAGVAAPWLPISLTPGATVDALLGWLPPAAMLAAGLTLDGRRRRAVLFSALGVVLASVILGIAQRAGGETSPLRLYALTNPDSAVGFFANRNHQGALLAVSLPLAAAAASGLMRGRRRWFWFALAVGFCLIAAVGVVQTGSRAASGLMVIGVVGAAAILGFERAGVLSRRLAAMVAPAVLAAALVALAGLAFAPGLDRVLPARGGGEIRLSLNPEVARAGLAYAPFGAGAGAFPVVFQAFEPVEEMGPAYVNHAHNDLAETWLDQGVPGLALIAALVVWWLGASWRAMAAADAAPEALAGSLVVGMLLIHSLVDYPLRTAALSVLFAFACALVQARCQSAETVAPLGLGARTRDTMRLGSRV